MKTDLFPEARSEAPELERERRKLAELERDFEALEQEPKLENLFAWSRLAQRVHDQQVIVTRLERKAVGL